MKIKFWEKWNKEAQLVEQSMTRLLQVAVLLYMFYFDVYFLKLTAEIEQEVYISANFILINLVFLIAAFVPKYLKDLVDIKKKDNK